MANIGDIASVIETEHRINMAQCSNGTTLHQLLCALELWMMRNHQRLSRMFARRVPRRDQLFELIRFQCDWLFAQHVLASFQRFDGPRHMKMVGQGNINRIDTIRAQQSLVVFKHFNSGSKVPKWFGLFCG